MEGPLRRHINIMPSMCPREPLITQNESYGMKYFDRANVLVTCGIVFFQVLCVCLGMPRGPGYDHARGLGDMFATGIVFFLHLTPCEVAHRCTHKTYHGIQNHIWGSRGDTVLLL